MPAATPRRACLLAPLLLLLDDFAGVSIAEGPGPPVGSPLGKTRPRSEGKQRAEEKQVECQRREQERGEAR
ncbi:Hypothetical protein SMAX5B_002664 [Scophthalmus maximus]|uniref:Uncharacterized protein n=1 Tax=Scophthalmus maximus TaxID=52904 RepID=A0A2U9BYZ8_SCOMX|nr:Hypothetical protein SMAX5B_002664 [Scophthalmus maximus]